MDRWWLLQHDDWADATRPEVRLGDTLVPTRWRIRQNPSLLWATVSLVRAADRLREGAEEISFSISPDHARLLADVLAQARGSLEGLGAMADPSGAADVKRWSEALAGVIVRGEEVVRLASSPARQQDDADAAAMAAGPLLQMVSLVLDERAEGELLAGLKPRDVGHVREVLAQVFLRAGFAVAGRRQPDDLRQEVAAAMAAGGDLRALERSLAEMLAERLRQSPPASGQSQLRKLVRAVTSYGPPALEVFEGLLRQWDRFESLEVEFRRHEGRGLLAVTVRVKDAQEVRLPQMVIMQPAIVFRGGCRIVVDPESPGTGETVVSFEPVEGGAVEVRFEGVLYGLVRVLALPLADAALREVRVATALRQAGRQMIHVAILMEARGQRGDPRRMLVFQDVRDKRLVREAFAVRSEVRRLEQSFHYVAPDRRYTYVRRK